MRLILLPVMGVRPGNASPDLTARRVATWRSSLHRNRISIKNAGEFAKRTSYRQAAARDTDRLLRERVGLMSGRSVLGQEVRRGNTRTAWTLIWLRHKIHHNR